MDAAGTPSCAGSTCTDADFAGATGACCAATTTAPADTDGSGADGPYEAPIATTEHDDIINDSSGGEGYPN